MKPSVLVAGIGNIFLGDDGFGTEVARKLAERELPECVRVADYGVSGMHLAYDLAGGYAATILLDTTERGGEPGTLYLIELDQDEIAGATTVDEQLGDGRFVDAHGMHPQSVLSLLTMLGGDAGKVWLIGCEPADLYPGIGLSATVQAVLEHAADMVVELLEEIVPSIGVAGKPCQIVHSGLDEQEVNGMCLGIPGEVVAISEDRPDIATVDVSGVRRPINIGLLEDDPPKVGEWILIHVGFALSKIDEDEAKAAMEFLESIGQAYADELQALRESMIE